MSSRGGFGRLLTDIRPLRASKDFRRLWFGQSISQLGQQMSTIAIAYQVYLLTRSSFAVGLVGLCALFPLVLGGLYGGALIDAFDRRLVALWSAVGLWLCSGVLVVQALTTSTRWASCTSSWASSRRLFAVNNPARSAILPTPAPDVAPAGGERAEPWRRSTSASPSGRSLGGVVIAWHGVEAAYALDALTFTAAIYALLRLPSIPPVNALGRAPGLRSVVEGLRFLRNAPNLRMTFIIDLCAMVLAQPRALFPALALTVFAGSATTLGLLQAAPAIGSLVAFAVSGWISRIHRHGVAIAIAVVAYGSSVALAGVGVIGWPGALWLAVAFLAGSGAADMVSAAYRTTMLQSAAPDELRGRLQGVFTVVVAGGPRLGDFLIGSLAELTSEELAMVIGGSACIVGVLVSVALQRRFLTYDARDPTP